MLLKRAILPLLIASSLAHQSVLAQDDGCKELEGTPPGLYVTADEGLVFLIKDDNTVELSPGESAYANDTQLTCINKVPDFLDWPCTTDAAQSRKFATYKIDDLQASDNRVNEIVQRYFEIPEVIEPIPNWLEGESSMSLGLNEIVPFSTPEYWYQPNTQIDILDEKRPKVLIISLYVGINQVVVDNYTVDALRRHYGGAEIPVVFVFNDSNVVPISYFGANASMEEIQKAFYDRKIKLADVPMWQLGDHHFSPTAEEYKKLFDLPDLADLDPIRVEALKAQLETFGFSKKPVFVTFLEGGGLYIDDPARVSVALSMGIGRLPTVINFIEQDDHLRRCGPGTPVGAGGVSGATTPIGGANPPPGSVSPPSPPVSDS